MQKLVQTIRGENYMNELQITGAQIDKFMSYLKYEERSAGTLEKYLRDVRALAAWLNGLMAGQ